MLDQFCSLVSFPRCSIMEPQLLLREKEGRKEGRIEGTVDTMRDFGYGDAEIKKAIMQKYSLSEKEAEKYL